MAGDTPFRWIADEANALVAFYSDADHEVTIDLEPGPSISSSFFYVEVYEERFVRYAGIVAGRTRIRFYLPSNEAALRRMRIKVFGGGLPVPHDERVLNARVYHFTALPMVGEVVPRWRGFSIRGGWYRFEEDPEGGGFRWVNNDACIEIAHRVGSLELELEPGPGLGSEP